MCFLIWLINAIYCQGSELRCAAKQVHDATGQYHPQEGPLLPQHCRRSQVGRRQ